MAGKNFDDVAFLTKNKKSVSRFKNNKRKFNESVEMQTNRARRVNFKNYLRELEEQEHDELLELEEDYTNES
jgi:hypothetical protein